jgi:hypothetical protein
VLFEQQVALIVMQEIVGRHDAAGEEVASHPVRRTVGLEEVGRPAVHEDMHEELAAGLSQPAMRLISASWLRMCSNISTDTTRSKRSSVVKSFMSAVTTRTLPSCRRSALASMNRRCECEFETAVMRLFG